MGEAMDKAGVRERKGRANTIWCGVVGMDGVIEGSGQVDGKGMSVIT